jgi:hypothetical protein
VKLLKRASTLLALFALTGVGATFAADAQSENIQNFFLGNAPVTSSDLNPVLVLLAGPEGPPGPAGVAGKDGFVGLNGQDGKDGIDGAPGATGPQGEPGESVAVVALQVGDTNCPVGGSKLVAADGTESFICNGRPGQPGATGATGAKGDAGTPGTGGAGNGTRFGVGSLGIGACDDDVEVELKNQFAGGQFKMNQVVISGISDACDTYTLKVWLTVRATGALYGTGSVVGANYAFTSGDEIRCEKIVSNASWTGALNDRSVSIDATHICTNMTATRTVAPRLNSISARDLDDYVGFEIG